MLYPRAHGTPCSFMMGINSGSDKLYTSANAAVEEAVARYGGEDAGRGGLGYVCMCVSQTCLVYLELFQVLWC